MIIKQLKLGTMNNFTYLIGCEITHQAMVIDPAAEAETIVKEAEKANLSIQYILNTHGHSDHTAANGTLKELTDAKIIMHRKDTRPTLNIDIVLDEEKAIPLGEIVLRIIHTPGHTHGGICVLAEGNLFTGDTLFVDYIGRIDLAQSDPRSMKESLKKLMSLPENTIVWPGHDYGHTPNSTIGREKRDNGEVRFMLNNAT